MIELPRLSLSMLTSAAVLGLVACGQGASAPPSEEAAEIAASVPVAASEEGAVDMESADLEEGADHAHEAGEDHDHEDDHAGGSAHVHGIADLAFVIDGGKLTAEIISPLANFGLSEADGVFTNEVVAALPGLITLTGGNCTQETPVGEVDTSSGHTDGRVSFSWACANPNDVTAASFSGFDAFPGFETINAVYIGDTIQKAAVLTPSSPEISLK